MKNHEFLRKGTFPEILPISTLVCPPSSTFCRQYFRLQSPQKINSLSISIKERFESTAPVQSTIEAIKNTLSAPHYKNANDEKIILPCSTRSKFTDPPKMNPLVSP